MLLNAALTSLCTLVVIRGWLPLLFSSSLITWSLFGFLASISLAEIPLMIYGMRKMLGDPSSAGRVRPLVAATHSVFVFFAAVYAAPQFLLTGSLALGLLLSTLGLLRWGTAFAFLEG